MKDLTIEQRFALQRARYEVSRMSRHELERTAVKLLQSRMQQKNGVQNGVVFKIEEKQEGLPEIISEESFIELLQMQSEDDSMPTDIMDPGWEDDDIDNDGLMMM